MTRLRPQCSFVVHSQKLSGGIDFVVKSDGFSTVDNPVFSAAWMVPSVTDPSTNPSLRFIVKENDMEFLWCDKPVTLKIHYIALVPHDRSGGMCTVKQVGDQHYAVLTRDLLCFKFVQYFFLS